MDYNDNLQIFRKKNWCAPPGGPLKNSEEKTNLKTGFLNPKYAIIPQIYDDNPWMIIMLQIIIIICGLYHNPTHNTLQNCGLWL